MFAQSAEQSFQQAVILEEAQGDLEGAIDLYTALAEDASAERSLRARALLQSGLCYEKLGRKNAIRVYEKLVSEFPDQKEMLELAQQKLRQLQPVPTTSLRLTTELINHETSTRKNIYRVSPDGRYYVFINWDSMELMKYDIEQGVESPITSGNSWFPERDGLEYGSIPDGAIWSPDSKKVAYAWYSEIGNQVRVRDIDGKNMRVLVECRPGQTVRPVAFRPDGKSLYAVSSDGESEAATFILIETATGSINNLIDLGTIDLGVYDFDVSPSGDYGIFSAIADKGGVVDLFLVDLEEYSFTKLTENEANDFKPVWSPDGGSIIFVSDRSGSNDLMKLNISNGEARGTPSVLASDIGENVDMLSVATDWTVSFKVENERYDVHTLNVEEYLTNGRVISKQITPKIHKHGGMAPSYSPSGRYISYLSPMSNQQDFDPAETGIYHGARYFINIYDTEKDEYWEVPTEFYTNQHWSDINEYVPQWSHDGTKLLMHGKTREDHNGGFYLVDVRSGELTPLITRPNSFDSGYFRAGRFPKYSFLENKFYYISSSWTELHEFNVDTREDRVLLTDSLGFFFTAVSSDESQFLLLNRTGRYFFDRKEEKLIRIGYDDGFPFALTSDGQRTYVIKDAVFTWCKKIAVIPSVTIDGNYSESVIDFDTLYPEGRVWLISKHPRKEELVFGVKTGYGQKVMRLQNVFN